jgi:ribonuclease HII
MTKAERLERDIKKLAEMKAHEDELRAAGFKYIAGIDEVGRGPLAGPVYAACVVLPDDWDIPGINDSKKLSAKKREELSDIIKSRALAYGIGIADNTEIDGINILEATKNAMKRAVDACNAALGECTDHNAGDETGDASPAIDMLLIDAVKLDTDTASESIIKGDEKSLSIAAASIVAKVARDSYMTEMDEIYPGYDFASNKGYGTAKHYDGLRALGYTPLHRRAFLRKFEESGELSKNNKKSALINADFFY